MSEGYALGFIMAAFCFLAVQLLDCSGKQRQQQQEQQRLEYQREIDAIRLKMDAHPSKLNCWYI